MATFLPIRGTKTVIDNTPIVDGQFLMTTDLGVGNNIYLDSGTQRIDLNGKTASSVTITDTNNYFTSGNVEGALSEVGSAVVNIEDELVNINTELVEKVTQINNDLANIGSIRTFMGTLTLFSSLPTTYGLADRGKYFYVSETGYDSNYCWSYNEATSTGTWNNIGNNVNIGEGAVDEKRTTFMKTYYNMFDHTQIESGYCWNNVGNVVTKQTVTNMGALPLPIKLKAGVTYNISRLTTSLCWLADAYKNVISKLNEYSGYATVVRGSLAYYAVTPTSDMYLYLTYATNLSYSTVMVVEGFLPYTFKAYNVPYKKTIEGKKIADQIHYNEIIVDLSGSGDYTNLATAVATLTDGDYYNQTNIIIKDGTYNLTTELTPPDYCNFIGYSGRPENCIIKYNPTTPSDADVTNYSTFRLNKNHLLKNLTIIGGNCRYAIHSDSSNTYKNWTQELENCIVEHLTNTTGSWTSQSAWGGGASSGCVVKATECKFIAHTTNSFGFSVHNNTGFTKPFRHYFDKCEFLSDNYCSFKVEGLVSGTDDRVYISNSIFKGSLYLTNVLSIKLLVSGSTHVQCNSTNYFEPNSQAVYSEYSAQLLNNSGVTIPAGTLVCFDGDGNKIRKMLSTDSANIFAGFTIGETTTGSYAFVVKNGWYRYTDNLTFGIQYGVDNGLLSSSATNKIGLCVGGGFVKVKNPIL